MFESPVLPKVFSLQQLVLHQIAKKFWGNFVLKNNIKDENKGRIKRLVSHRETVSSTIYHQMLAGAPGMKNVIEEAVVCLQQGYIAALIWENRCRLALRFTILNPLTAGPYAAKGFINPAGQFDDFAWAELFIADESQLILSRFKLACFYCFEEALTSLWDIIRNCIILNEEMMESLYLPQMRLVALWNSHLEGELNGNFYTQGFRAALLSGHEYATRYFWEHCSTSEKINCFENFNFNHLIQGALNNEGGLICFIYSLLPIEKKKGLFSCPNPRVGHSLFLSSLLQPTCCKIVLNDILMFFNHIPLEFYENVIPSMIDLIGCLKIPSHKIVLKTLWNRLPEKRKKTLLYVQYKKNMIYKLAEINATDLLEMIIQPLPNPIKNKLLLSKWYTADTGPFKKLFEMGKYDSSVCYLLYFLIDFDPATQRRTLRGDANRLLDRFFTGKPFLYWFEGVCSASKRKKVNKLKEYLYCCLEVLDQLLQQSEEEHGRMVESTTVLFQALKDLLRERFSFHFLT